MTCARHVVAAALAAGMLAAAGAAGARCTLVKIAEWQTRPGTGSPVVDGTINGRKVGILLDTGAGTALLRSAAIDLGLVRHGDYGGRAIGIGGETAVEVVTVDSFAIGDTVRRNWGMRVLGETDLGGDIAGLLGEDFFHRADVEFDLAHDRVRLFEAKDCADVALAYWTTETPGVVEFTGYSEAFPTIEVPVAINGRSALAQLDSGAFQSVLTKAQAEAAGVTPDTTGVVAAGCSHGLGAKQIRYWIGPFDSFAIGNEVVRNPRIEFADLFRYSRYAQTGSMIARSTAHPDMLLGADFLRAHRVLVAHSQRRIYFTHAGGNVFTARPDRACGEPVPSAPDAKPAK